MEALECSIYIYLDPIEEMTKLVQIYNSNYKFNKKITSPQHQLTEDVLTVHLGLKGTSHSFSNP